MRMISKSILNGKIVITTEEKKLFRKKIRQFEANQKPFVPGYWEWLELPDYLIVPDVLSFQLNSWNMLKGNDE